MEVNFSIAFNTKEVFGVDSIIIICIFDKNHRNGYSNQKNRIYSGVSKN